MKIFFNGNIYPNAYLPPYQAMVVENGTILATGTNEEILNFKDDHCTVINLNKKYLYPGFNDSHLHLIGIALQRQKFNLQNITSIKELIIKSKTQLLKENSSWLIGYGWNQDQFEEKRKLTKHDLDQISQDIPICFIRSCTHLCTVNSKALEILKISKDSIIDHNLIDIDENLNLIGILFESAVNSVYEKQDKPTIEKIQELILTASNILISYGITSVHSDDLRVFANCEAQDIVQAYQELVQKNLLPIRIYQQCLFLNIEQMKEFYKKYNYSNNNSFYQLGCSKILLDGSLGANSALLSVAYLDDHSTNGISRMTDQELSDMVDLANLNSQQIAIHGIGDLAIKKIIAQFKRINNYSKRHGIIHCQITDEIDLCDIKKNHILTYVQPIFLDYDIQIIKEKISDNLANTSYAFKTLSKNQKTMSIGTDSPIDTVNPFHNLYCAITRESIKTKENLNEKETLNIFDAFNAYTVNSAYASFEELTKGQLLPGFKADFFILKQDLFKSSKHDLLNLEVLSTYVDGNCVYEKNIS